MDAVSVMTTFLLVAVFVIGFVALLAVPGIIAIVQKHQYKWAILALGVGSPITFGAAWLVAIAWVLWPKNKAKSATPSTSKTASSEEEAVPAAPVQSNQAKALDKDSGLMAELAEIDKLHFSGAISAEERSTLRLKALSED
jgi:hypothetical protein